MLHALLAVSLLFGATQAAPAGKPDASLPASADNAKAALEKLAAPRRVHRRQDAGRRRPDPHVDLLPRAEGQGGRRHRHPGGLRPDRLAPRASRTSSRRTASSPSRPTWFRASGPGGGGTDSVSSRDDVVALDARDLARGGEQAARRGARLGDQAPRRQRQGRPPSASAGAAGAASPMPARSPSSTARSSTTAALPTRRSSPRSRRRSSGHYGGDDARVNATVAPGRGGDEEARQDLRDPHLRGRGPRLPARPGRRATART